MRCSRSVRTCCACKKEATMSCGASPSAFSTVCVGEGQYL
jgi:hypothetical protein